MRARPHADHTKRLGGDTEGRITDFFTHGDLGRVRATEREARGRSYSAATTEILVPQNMKIPASFWGRYVLGAVTSIKATRSRITDADLKHIAQHCPRLSSLNLDVCNQITDASVTELARRCSQLSSLNLKGCWKITDAGVVAVSQGCPQLSSLDLSACDQITDAAVIALAQGCPQLSSLDLKYCDQISDAGVIALGRHCPLIFSLRLTSEEDGTLTDAGVVALAQGCPRLSLLDLSECWRVADRGVLALAQHCPQLTYLNLCSCYDVTDASVINVAENCPNLRTVAVRGTEVTSDSLYALAQNCPNLSDFSPVELVDDENLRVISQNCPNLFEFEISFGRDMRVTDAGLQNFVQQRPNLKQLQCDVVKGRALVITNVGLKAVAQHCRRLEYFYFYDGPDDEVSDEEDSDEENDDSNTSVTKGVVAVLKNCPFLSGLVLDCDLGSDECLDAIAENSKHLTTLEMSPLKETTMTIAALRNVIASCPRLTELQLNIFWRARFRMELDDVREYLAVPGHGEVKLVLDYRTTTTIPAQPAVSSAASGRSGGAAAQLVPAPASFLNLRM